MTPAGAHPPLEAMGAPHSLSPAEVAAALATRPEDGLTEGEAAERLELHGPNRPRRQRRPNYAVLAARQLVDPLVLLLVGAAAVSAAIGDELEGAAIGVVVVLNAALSFVQEAGAERAILALQTGFTQSVSVVRDGREQEVSAEVVVPGDVLVLREGMRVAADARLLRLEGLEVDESSLTGESLPIGKSVASVPAATPLADRSSMVYAGTGVTRGRGRAVVCSTGEATELGLISQLAAEAKPPPTPLQHRLGRLAREMVLLGTALTLLLAAAMLAQGSSLHRAFLVAVAVAVAAVPEGLAATVTVALALGARMMARRGAIVRRLSAIETLGETTVICTDKTGTLTENRIRLAGVVSVDGVPEREVLAAAVLASSAELVEGEDGPRPVGDPIEVALLLAAMERGLSRRELLAIRQHVREIPFDAERKRMTVVYEERDTRRAYTKGAPEVVLARTAAARERDRVSDAAAAWAEEGFRVLAVAERSVSPDAQLDEGIECDLRLLGLVALHDPLRESAPAAIAEARAAGVEVHMLTGDHPATARTIARALGLPDSAVFARVTPAEKLRLVEDLQAAGHVVAVTGDGVNDAPALRRADVGVAMGRSGTEAAREAASIVLTDDDFATIVAALREGRRIADNIRKFVAFLLSANFGEVVLFAAAVVSGLGAPMAVIQILLVNVVTDGFPAIALARDPASAETMALGPRRGRRLFGADLWRALAAVGVAVGGVGLAAYVAGRELDAEAAQTMAFATVALSELALVFACRSALEAAWRLPRNVHLLAGVSLSALVVGAVIYLPALNEPFATEPLSLLQLSLVLGLAVLPLVLVEAGKAALRRRAARAGRQGRR